MAAFARCGLTGAPKSFRRSLTIAQRAIAALRRRRGELRPDTPAQRPLARRRVVLSRRVVAYYGLIRASGTLRAAYGFAGRSLPRRRGPEGPCFALRILPSVPPSVPRQTGRPKDDSTSARDSLRPNARGSASASSHLNRYTWVPFRGCEVRLMLRPGRLLALHRQGRLRSSFHPMSHLIRTSNMTTRANRQFPAAGLAPAGFAALQAAPHSGQRSGVARRS